MLRISRLSGTKYTYNYNVLMKTAEKLVFSFFLDIIFSEF